MVSSTTFNHHDQCNKQLRHTHTPSKCNKQLVHTHSLNHKLLLTAARSCMCRSLWCGEELHMQTRTKDNTPKNSPLWCNNTKAVQQAKVQVLAAAGGWCGHPAVVAALLNLAPPLTQSVQNHPPRRGSPPLHPKCFHPNCSHPKCSPMNFHPSCPHSQSFQACSIAHSHKTDRPGSTCCHNTLTQTDTLCRRKQRPLERHTDHLCSCPWCSSCLHKCWTLQGSRYSQHTSHCSTARHTGSGPLHSTGLSRQHTLDLCLLGGTSDSNGGSKFSSVQSEQSAKCRLHRKRTCNMATTQSTNHMDSSPDCLCTQSGPTTYEGLCCTGCTPFLLLPPDCLTLQTERSPTRCAACWCTLAVDADAASSTALLQAHLGRRTAPALQALLPCLTAGGATHQRRVTAADSSANALPCAALPCTQDLPGTAADCAFKAALSGKATCLPTEVCWAAANPIVEAGLSCLAAVGATHAGWVAAAAAWQHSPNLAALASDQVALLVCGTAALVGG